MAFDTRLYQSGEISSTPSGQSRWIRGNLLMSRDRTQSIHKTFVCIMAKSQIKFGLRHRQKFSRAKKAFYLYSSMICDVSRVVDPMVLWTSRPTSNVETRVGILLGTCNFSFISETCVESHWQFIDIFLSVFSQLVSGKIRFSSVAMIGDLPIS